MSEHVVEHLVEATTRDSLLPLRALAAYFSLPERKVRCFLRAAVNPLPDLRDGENRCWLRPNGLVVSLGLS